MEEKSAIQIKREEMEAKYADVINDLAVKYEKTIDIGFDMLVAIARTEHENRKKEENEEKLVPEYETSLELNMEELLADYEEYLGLSEESVK